MSRAIGDIFYPDNPNRRNRFNELLAQIRTYETEFQALEKKKYAPIPLEQDTFIPSMN